MMKYSFSLLAAVALAVPAMGAEVVLDDCNQLGGWIWEQHGYNGQRETVVEFDATEKFEGAGSIKVSYANWGDAYWEYMAVCPLAQPIDLSAFTSIKFNTKLMNDANGKSIPMFILALDEKDNGYFCSVDKSTTTEWQEMVCSFDKFTVNSRGNAYVNNVAISRITKLVFATYLNAAAESPTYTNGYWIDNIRFDDTAPVTKASESILKCENVADWEVYNGGGYTDENHVADNTVAVTKDGNAFRADIQFGDHWYTSGFRKDLPTITDLSQYSSVRVKLKGNIVNEGGLAGYVQLNLIDENGAQADARMNAAATINEWVTVDMPVILGSASGAADGVFIQNVWDGDKNLDMTKIKTVRFTFMNNGDSVNAVQANVWIEELTGIKTIVPPPYKTVTAVRATSPLVFDGTGSDAQWLQAPWANGFEKDAGVAAGADFQSQFKVMYDDNQLYFLVEYFTGATAKKFYAPDANSYQNQRGYYNPDTGDWVDSFGVWLCPKNNSDGGIYQICQYMETDSSAHQPSGSNNGYVYGATYTPGWGGWDQSSGAIICKAKEMTDKVVFEIAVPYTSLTVAACNTGSAAVQPAPADGDEWYLQVSRSSWTTSDTTEASEDSMWCVDPNNPPSGASAHPMGAVRFGAGAAVTDWSLF
ncbi:MAG: sugar-binding protein [Candidatus Sumerlaeales bacterium]|nr:sugar-binding protein [Candidatus Sumerlaeales bacterium]